MPFPILDGQKVENGGAVPAGSQGTNVTAAGSTNTKGNYSQLIAATSVPAKGLFIVATNAAAGVDYLLDIAIGAAASEQVILENLLISASSIPVGSYYFFPCEIPAGMRIAARVQATTLSSAVRVSVQLLSGGFAQAEGFTGVETMGADTSDSGGISLDPGGTTHTKGSYVQISAACARNLKGLTIATGMQLNTARSNTQWLMDIAIGGAGSEQIIISNLPFYCNSSGDVIFPQVYNFIPILIPEGSRIAARIQCDSNDASDRLMDVVFYGVF